MEGRAGWCGRARGCCSASPEAAERRIVEALLACSGGAAGDEEQEEDEEEEAAARARGAWAEEVHGWRRSAPYSLPTPNSARRRGATGPSTAPARGSAATFRHGTPGRPAAARRAARESGGPGAARETWDLAAEPGARLATLQQTAWGRWTGDKWTTRMVHSEGSSPRGCYPDPNEQDEEEKDGEQDEEEEHEEVEARGEVEELCSAASRLHVAPRALVRDEDCATSTDERNEDGRGAHHGPVPESGSKAGTAHDSDQGPDLPPSFSLYSVLPPVRSEARGSLANPASGLSDPWRHLDADVLKIDNCRRVESAPAGRGSGGLNYEPRGRRRWWSSRQPAAGRAARRATGSRAHERAARVRCGVGTAGRRGGRTGKDVAQRSGSGGGSGGDGGDAESVGNARREGFETRDEHRAGGRLPLVQGCKVRIPMVPHTLLL
ncbi:uncharacterized protein LOC133340270 [Lethenteron reissneri]|uniref:uncharacterized protein LOC133340270 n=1 Tax=Lethenteron reissneri TaxID=7753 RepID=UPI002AB7ADFC|nr:uncharacterized protein LOC133340270 [Lethenteron reissneri]